MRRDGLHFTAAEAGRWIDNDRRLRVGQRGKDEERTRPSWSPYTVGSERHLRCVHAEVAPPFAQRRLDAAPPGGGL